MLVAPVVWVEVPVRVPPLRILDSLSFPVVATLIVVRAPELVVTLTRPVALALPLWVWVDWTVIGEPMIEPVKVLPSATTLWVVLSETSTTFSVWSATTSAS